MNPYLIKDALVIYTGGKPSRYTFEMRGNTEQWFDFELLTLKGAKTGHSWRQQVPLTAKQSYYRARMMQHEFHYRSSAGLVGPNEDFYFKSNVTSGSVPLHVLFKPFLPDEENKKFRDQKVEFFWDFGDGKTSIKVAPTHMYSKPGTYDVSLKVTFNVDQSNEYSLEETYTNLIDVGNRMNSVSIGDQSFNKDVYILGVENNGLGTNVELTNTNDFIILPETELSGCDEIIFKAVDSE